MIATYNRAHLLPETLHSVLHQKFRDFEVIVADNNSRDKTREVAKKFDAKIVSGGLPGAGRNRGAEIARGEMLLFVDADIIFPASDFLEKSLKEIESRELGIATCYLLPMSEKLVDKFLHGVFNRYMKLVQGFSPHAPGFCVFVRRDIFKKLKGFNEEITLAEDHEFTKRAKKICNYGILKSYKIPVSVRRFDRDGRAKIAAQYALCELYMWTRGAVKSDIFKYRFGYGEADVLKNKGKRLRIK